MNKLKESTGSIRLDNTAKKIETFMRSQGTELCQMNANADINVVLVIRGIIAKKR